MFFMLIMFVLVEYFECLIEMIVFWGVGGGIDVVGCIFV